jgi:hypothetical protein
MDRDKLKEMYEKYNLEPADIFKHKHYVIIARSGIDKIQSTAKIRIKYATVHLSDDLKFACIKAVATMEDEYIETYGEASPANTNNAYPVAMAEKRAMSRAVLKLTGFYAEGHFGEDEADSFKRPEKVEIHPMDRYDAKGDRI